MLPGVMENCLSTITCLHNGEVSSIYRICNTHEHQSFANCVVSWVSQETQATCSNNFTGEFLNTICTVVRIPCLQYHKEHLCNLLHISKRNIHRRQYHQTADFCLCHVFTSLPHYNQQYPHFSDKY
jgi:hypothetical protein